MKPMVERKLETSARRFRNALAKVVAAVRWAPFN